VRCTFRPTLLALSFEPMTLKEILGPLATSACAKPDSSFRCDHEGPQGELTCQAVAQ
jgi:hypothetical protein